MSAESGDLAAQWEASQRERAADARDARADERDAAGDDRDLAARARDEIADAREDQLRSWAARLERRARRLGLAWDDIGADADLSQAAAARGAADAERARKDAERQEAAELRRAATLRRTANHRDALLAAAFAGIAEYLHESASSEELLTRIAEAAVATIAGSSKASVIVDHPLDGEDRSSGAQTAAQTEDDGPVLSFALSTSADPNSEGSTGLLTIFADDPSALDEAAEDMGVILAAHASVAARALGERERLERMVRDLEQTLASRDIIGQAKGILMQRLRTTPDQAFEILKRSSQLLNIKLREVARTLAETGELPRRHPDPR